MLKVLLTVMTAKQKYPAFAVVGHPNKGKSSIVATLTRQDAVRISEISGTTTKAQAFDLVLDGHTHYSLIDTPGFQRPRQVLDWLVRHNPNAAQRRQTIGEFLHQQQQASKTRYPDELELLSPILAGAGILYVVDGSLPYSAEFEAEMTLLQWTGQPRMALINPIGGEAHVAQWQNALSQYFSIVRVFDPMTADLDKQLTVLRAFAELHEDWRPSIEHTVQRIQQHRADLLAKGAVIIVEALQSMFAYRTEQKMLTSSVQTVMQETLKYTYQQRLREQELAMQRQLQALFAHLNMQTQDDALAVVSPDLFDHQHWYLYGLDRQKIVALAASAGAAAGAVIDVGLGGASLMVGALAGGLLSGAASLAATWKPEKLTVKGIPLAGKSLTIGPVTDLTFAFVLLGRAIDYLALVHQRTHADRRLAEIKRRSMTERMQQLAKTDQVRLTRVLQRAHKGISEKDQQHWCDWIIAMVEVPKSDD